MSICQRLARLTIFSQSISIFGEREIQKMVFPLRPRLINAAYANDASADDIFANDIFRHLQSSFFQGLYVQMTFNK